jgi:hypothetical protein
MNPQNFTIREQGKMSFPPHMKTFCWPSLMNELDCSAKALCSLKEAKNAVEDLMDNEEEDFGFLLPREDEQVRPSSQMRTIDDDWEISSDR